MPANEEIHPKTGLEKFLNPFLHSSDCYVKLVE